MELSASAILLVLYLGCGVAMVLGMRMADRFGLGDDPDSEESYRGWLGWLIGYDRVDVLTDALHEDEDPSENGDTPWIIERLADLLLIIFGPAMLIIVGLMVLARRMMGR